MKVAKRTWVYGLVFCLLLQLIGWARGPVQTAVAAAYDPALQPAVIAGGTSHTLFLNVDGTVSVSGSSTIGSLGLGSASSTITTPQVIPGLKGVIQVDARLNSSYALLEDGSVMGWGQNASGQLGLGDSIAKYSPTKIAGLSNVRQIAAGDEFAIAVLQDGSLMAWGKNVYGELGSFPTATTTLTPTKLTGISNVKQVSIGYKFVTALLQDGTMMTWGYNDQGQLGNGNTTNSSVPTLISTGTLSGQRITQIVAGYNFVLALLANGAVSSWGDGAQGQLGNNATIDSKIPILVSGLSNVRYISAGMYSSVAVLNDDTIMTWGHNGYGQLGTGDTATKLVPTLVPIDSRVSHAYNGYYNTFIVDYDSNVYAAGYNSSYQLALGDNAYKSVFSRITNLKVPSSPLLLEANLSYLFDGDPLAIISSPYSYSSYLLKDGQVYAWGLNSYGQLGLGDTTSRYIPTLIPGLSGVKQLAVGYYFVLALLEDGTVKGWGYNSSYRLGLGTTTSQYSPVTINMGGDKIKQVAAGYDHALALTENDNILGWGSNSYGQLGLGTSTIASKATPTLIATSSGMKQVVAGNYYSLGLSENGKVYSWGLNTNYQLGLGTSQSSILYSMTLVSSIENVAITQLAAGSAHVLALDSSGNVYAWGYNYYSQLGMNGTASLSSPTLLPITGIKQVAAGYSDSMALMNDGTVMFWGRNIYGKSGNSGTGSTVTVPTQIPNLTSIKQISSGYFHSLAMDQSGGITSWGYNSYGQLGLGVSNSSTNSIPAPVTFGADLASIRGSVSGPYDSKVRLKYYLDEETQPREEKTIRVPTTGTADYSFSPLDNSTLSNGSHTIRVVSSTPYQTTQKTLTLSIDREASALPTTITPSANSITASIKIDDSASVSSSSPYRITVGSKTSGWVSNTLSQTGTVSSTEAMDFSGAGARNIVKLANGWWVIAGYSGNPAIGIRFMVSKDNGQSWSQLATLADDGSIVSAPSITAVGNQVAGIVRAGSSSIWSFSFDAVSQADENIIGDTIMVDSGQTDISLTDNVSVAVDSNNKIHAVWSSKNPSYSSRYNIRYSQSSDGGKTWSAVTQFNGGTSYDSLNPEIVIINNLPVIFYSYNNGSTYYIYKYSFNGSSWSLASIYAGAAYIQERPSVYVDGSNVYLAWASKDSTDTAVTNIRFMRSTDGGSTWQTSIKLTSGNSYVQKNPAITKDNAGKLYVLFSGIDSSVSTVASNLRLVTSADGTTWTTPTALTSLTSGSADQPLVPRSFKMDYLTNNPTTIYQDTTSNKTVIRGTNSSGYTYTASGLTSNTQYKVTVEVKDSSSIIRLSTQDVYTLAAAPTLSVSTSGKLPVLTVTDTNPATTQYQIMSGSKYLTTEGKWVNNPVSFALPSKKLILTDWDAKKSYSLKARALNSDGMETEWSPAVSLGQTAAPPASPKNVKLQSTSSSVLINWSPVSEATDYEIEIDGLASLISTGGALSYVHSGVTSNTLHIYRVRALIEGTPGAWSTPQSIRTLLVKPIVPLQITANATAKTATITWASVANASAYELEWDGNAISVGNQTLFVKRNLPVASQHSYRVRALNAGGAGPWSGMKFIMTTSALPNAPVPAASRVGHTSATIAWATLDDATAYEVEADGVLFQVGNVPSSEFTGLLPQSNHQYRVRALNEMGAGNWSSLLTIQTNLLPTPAKTTETISDTSITFSWEGVEGAARYEVQADGSTISVISTSYTHSSLQPESNHSYRIRAVSSAGYSGWTEIMTYSTLPLKPSIPMQISATASKDQIYLTWSAVSEAVGYEVEIDGQVVIDNFNATTYTDILLDSFSEHQYRIRSRSDAVQGDWSTLIAIRTQPERPATPANIVVNSMGNLVTLEWTADPSAIRYEVEVDGTVTNIGDKSKYTHRRVAKGTEHRYRIRTINVSGTGDWSGIIINNTVTAKLTKAKMLDFGLVGVNVLDFTKYTLQVSYDPNAMEVTDLSTLTAAKELSAGPIAGTSLSIISFKPGLIVFTTDHAVSLDESWTGVINSIQIKAKVSGGSSLTYSVIEKPVVSSIN
ncbi:RCC1 domain-containing protein [Cohnella fermenti]|uniref:Fibronectin type-III domain-containing protein n=1 Tax=Cohnella fermenti TaxID=2565925 RepID=A0A4S4C1Y7_9BACL|nr:exo-alpha-sialidase [Cohnella fermenti]THF81683.1 hypothetical protein E6C55_08110 [Cohnella fermenti]